MSRLIFIIVIVAVIFWWFRSMRKGRQQDQSPDLKQQDQTPRAEDMVRCAECGVHLPKNESYFVGGEYYCSEAHSRSRSGKSD